MGLQSSGSRKVMVRLEHSPQRIEKFIVFSALFFCFSCCLLLL